MTRSIARSLCDSWASCLFSAFISVYVENVYCNTPVCAVTIWGIVWSYFDSDLSLIWYIGISDSDHAECCWTMHATYINPLEFRGSYSATSSNTKLVYTGRWWVGLLHFVQWGRTGRGCSPPSPSSLYWMQQPNPSMASVPIIVLLYNGPLLCGFNVAN